jgi:hypothetical protein
LLIIVPVVRTARIIIHSSSVLLCHTILIFG